MKYKLSQYDFLDLGSKTGGSIKYCSKRFRTGEEEKDYAKGIGIDLNPHNVAEARQAGFDVIEQDVLELNTSRRFKFVTALDFLEHMHGVEGAEKIVIKMSELATDFVFIRHPSFEDVEYLKQLGLKITWTDMSVHTAPIKIYDFVNMFNKLGLKQYCFNYKKDLASSESEFIVPLDAPTDTQKYHNKLGAKKRVKFEKKVYSQIDIFLPLKPIEPKAWEWITRED